MKVRESVFGSRTEKAVYASLLGFWEPEYHIYHNLPFPLIVDFNANELPYNETSFLLKTSVDFTVCENDGKPIFSIEFDGIGGGTSKEGVYQPARQTIDPKRKWKLDLKLRIASEVSYPLVVISFPETQHLDTDDPYMILHSVIGQFLAGRSFGQFAQEAFERDVVEAGIDLDALDPDERQFVIDDIGITAEVLSQMKYDPIYAKSAEYDNRCISEFGVKSFGQIPLAQKDDLISVRAWVQLPAPPPNLTHAKIAEMKRDFEALRECLPYFEHTFEEKNFLKIVTKAATLRNIETIGVSPDSLAWNIAEYLTWKRAYKLLTGE